MDVLITPDDFDVAVEYERVRQVASNSGAVVFFVGLVRDFYQDARDDELIDCLELQHYPGMTEKLCQDIVDDAKNRFEVETVRVIHRVGQIRANEQIVMVAVASQHRGSAFNAAQFVMDYLKTKATFWKKEVGTRGEQWIGLNEKDDHAASRWASESESR